MGIFDFSRDAGSSIVNPGEDDQVALAAFEAQRCSEAKQRYRALVTDLNRKTAARLTELVAEMGFATTAMFIDFDVVDGRVTVSGAVPTQDHREKLILLLGNNQGVAQVDDRLVVDVAAPTARFYTVVKGDTLSRIAKAQYGDALKYPAIFEANRPMLRDPDLIYPGQVLRIAERPSD